MDKDPGTYRKSPWRFAFLALAMLGGAELLGGLVAVVLYLLLGDPGKMVSDSSSLGIIGGADGPTAIFVAYSVPTFVQVLVPLAMVVLGIWGYRRLKRCRQKS